MYVDALKIKNRIHVLERSENDNRRIRTYPAEYVVYYPDDDGDYTAISGEKLTKYSSSNFFDHREFVQTLNDEKGLTVFESDVNPVYRLLEEKYPSDDGPDLHVSIFDIEVDKDPEKGFATMDNPYAPITANSIHNKWNDEAITLVVPPPNLTADECRKLLDGDLFQDSNGELTTERPEDDVFKPMLESDGYFVVEDEEELIRLSMALWEDADVLSGWNSEFFDIPYFIHRMRIVLGEESIQKIAMEKGTQENPYNPSKKSKQYINQLNLFDVPPSLRMVEHYGNMEKTYNLHGRIHLDYLALYRKFTFKELHSYTLDSILKLEIEQEKVAYNGSLDQLYRKDFRRFTAYSRQDTMGLSALDDKLKFIALANNMSHLAGVTIDQSLGTVALVEQAILKELHKQNLICFDRKDVPAEYPIPGAYVLSPIKGIYEWIGSTDFNSLYPTIIRMLNLSPETIVGWVNPKNTLEKLFQYMGEGMNGATAWSHFLGTDEYNMVVNKSDDLVEFIVEDNGETMEISGSDLHEIIEENNWVISAFGLVLHRDVQGIVPYCLEKWYKQRIEYKKNAKTAYNKSLDQEGDVKQKSLFENEYWNSRQQIQKTTFRIAHTELCLMLFCRI